MEIKRISLYDRLDNLNANAAAHPEYDGAVIRSMARMPIIQYLGDYDTFCDFQILTEVREDLPYQTVAKVIADQTWTPEDMTQILDMLARPVVQIERAYQQSKSALLPYRRRKQTKTGYSRRDKWAARFETELERPGYCEDARLRIGWLLYHVLDDDNRDPSDIFVEQMEIASIVPMDTMGIWM